MSGKYEKVPSSDATAVATYGVAETEPKSRQAGGGRSKKCRYAIIGAAAVLSVLCACIAVSFFAEGIRLRNEQKKSDVTVDNTWAGEEESGVAPTAAGSTESTRRNDWVPGSPYIFRENENPGLVIKKASDWTTKTMTVSSSSTSSSSSTTSTPAAERACVDSGTWVSKNNAGRNCVFVSKNPEVRCEKMGADGTRAGESCIASCTDCTTDSLSSTSSSTSSPAPIADAVETTAPAKAATDDATARTEIADAVETTSPAKATTVQDLQAPEIFEVKFSTTARVAEGSGDFVIEVTRAWAPIGADRFYQLVQDGFYDNAPFYRVVEGFVAQFGLAADPAMTEKWSETIADDRVEQSNLKGTITYATAGAGTRTTQVFVNMVDNADLDTQGFAPFGRVTEGFDVFQNLQNPTPNNSGGLSQGELTQKGNSWLEEESIDVDYIVTASLVLSE